MKKLYTLALLMAFAGGLAAQDMVTVTFRVDMSDLEVSSSGVFVTGDFLSEAGLGGDWNAPNAVAMSDDDMDDIYTVEVDLPAGDYLYKYTNGSEWADAEGGGDEDNYQSGLADCGEDNGFGGHNRPMTVPANQETFALPGYEFNSCEITVNVIDPISTVKSMEAAPNPFTTQTVLTIENPTQAAHDVTLTSLTGKVIRAWQDVRDNQMVIQRNELPSGIYFLSVRNERGEVATKKLMVQ